MQQTTRMMAFYAAFAVSLSGLCACQGYPFVGVTWQATDSLGVPYTVSTEPNTDILFVIDSSGSMADKQERLAQNAQAFIQSLVNTHGAFRIGIVSTDMYAAAEQGQLHTLGASARYLDSPTPSDPNLQASQQALVADFIAAVKAVGIAGDSREAGLAAAMAAMGRYAGTGFTLPVTNANFLRQDADLAVIILTDEDDCSRTSASLTESKNFSAEDCYRAENQNQLVDIGAAVSALAEAKGGDITRIRAAVIGSGIKDSNNNFIATSCLTAGSGVTNACGCWSHSGSGPRAFYCDINEANGQPCAAAASGTSAAAVCDPNDSCITPQANACVPQCSSMGAYRYQAFVRALTASRVSTGQLAGTVIDSVCLNDFSNTMLDIASNVVAPNCFAITAPVTDPSQVAVTLVGQTGSQTIPFYGTGSPSACNNSCDACPGGAWVLKDATHICLGCNLYPPAGDKIHISILDP